MAADVRFLFSAFMLSALIRVLGRAVPDQRPMPWRKNMTVGDWRTVADRIGGGTLCKKICKTAKGGSLPMTALALGCVFSMSVFPCRVEAQSEDGSLQPLAFSLCSLSGRAMGTVE